MSGSEGTTVLDVALNGLRILFGAAKAMIEKRRKFCEELSTYSTVTGLEAVELLQDVFRSFDRMIVLVDELSAAGSGKAEDVSSEIGRILDEKGNIDILVSSLSPQYIADLSPEARER